jgi:N-acetylmuramoyl-L-alanine amidase CwlA
LQRRASADFGVDDDTIVQINPDLRNYYCWAVGDKKNPYTGGGSLYKNANNKNTISIEICSNLKNGASADFPNHDGWYFTDKSLDNAAKLVRYLMKMFNIPKSNVVRHYDITGKLCPGIVGWNNANVYDSNGKATAQKSNSDAWMVFWSII